MKKTVSMQRSNLMSGTPRGMYGSTYSDYYGRGNDRSRSEQMRRKERSHLNRSAGGRSVSRAQVRTMKKTVLVTDIVKGHRIHIDSAPPVPVRQTLRELTGRISLRGILLMLLAGLAASAAVILMLFNFRTSTIYGNTKYSQEQIESFITRGRLGDNTFVMALKYHNRKVEDIPFIDRIDIDIVSPSTIRVNITEKPIDGVISYEGQNVYFSKEGVIQTVSGRVAEEATAVHGVELTASETGEQMHAKDQLGMELTLEALRDMAKYGIHADRIDVDESSSLTVSFGDVDVKIGKSGFEQKMFKLHQVLPHMDGRSGVISMTGFEYDYGTSDIVLSPLETSEEEGEA